MQDVPRTPYFISRDEFDMIFKLHQKQPWTLDKHDELYFLLQECENAEEQSLVLSLLSAYENFDEKRANASFKQIVKVIREDWKLSPRDTLIVASHQDGDSPGSAPAFLQQIKPFLSPDAWQDENLHATLTSILSEKSKGKNIVFVDDFVGTGGQFSKGFDWLIAELSKKSIALGNIYLGSLCIMNQAVPLLEERGIIHYATHYMEKGITGRLKVEEIEKAKAIMAALESRLKWSNKKQRDKYSLGFMQSEALFRYMENNVPNNNFPIFWWKESSDNLPRQTIQARF